MTFYNVDYRFTLPDGREFRGNIKSRMGRLKEQFRNLPSEIPVTVEYLVDDPTVNRLKGDGNETLQEWLWRRVGIGMLLLILFLSPGVAVIRDAFRAVKRRRLCA